MDRNIIIQEARSWVGTAFHHQGRLKRTSMTQGGCDCIGLILGVAERLDLKSLQGGGLIQYDTYHYGRTPSSEQLIDFLDAHFLPVVCEDISVGDVALCRMGRLPQHVAILGSDIDHINEPNTLIHCYTQVGKVVEHRIDRLWKARIVRAYRFEEVYANDIGIGIKNHTKTDHYSL